MRSKAKTAFQAVALSEYEDPGDYNREFYTPTATKPPLIIALLCSVLACIALLQVAASKSVNGAAVGTSAPPLLRRQDVSSASTSFSSQASAITEASYLDTSTPPAVGSSTTTSPENLDISTSSTTESGAPPPTAYLDTSTSTVGGSSATAPEAYLTITSSVEPPTTIPQTTTTGYLDTSTPTVGGSSATAPGAYLTISSPVEPTTPTVSATTEYLDTSAPPAVPTSTTPATTAYLDSSTAYLDTSTPPAVPTSTSVHSAYLDTSKPVTTQPEATASTAYLDAAGSSSKPTSTHPTVATLGASTPTLRTSPTDAPVSQIPDASYLDTATLDSSITIASPHLDTSYHPSAAVTTSTWFSTAAVNLYASSPPPPTETPSTAASTPSGTAFVGVTPPTTSALEVEPMLSTGTSNTSPTITSTSTSAASTSNPAGVVDITKLPQTDRLITGTFTMTRYYMGTYLCPLVVVLLKCVWGVVFASTKMVEPFYQLTRPGGADVRASLLADYLSSGFSTTALSSLFTARPVMLAAILVSATTAVMAPIASEAMSIQPSGMCPTSSGGKLRCAPVWILTMPCIRLLQAFLGATFCLITTYLILNFRRDSGIFSDPSSIASMASLLGNDDFIRELRDIPADASKKDIKRLLAGNKYVLATFTRSGGKPTYGIVRADDGRWHDGYHVANLPYTSSAQAKKNSAWKSGYLHDILLFLLSGGILAVIFYYYKDFRNDGFNRFFNSSGFGPRFVLSSAATVLDNRWKRLEREVRMMQPYRTLYKKSGSKASTKALLAHTASTTYTSFVIALWRGDFFLALVSFVAILADALIIAVVGVPFSYGQIYLSFQISTWLSVSILSLMILTSLAVMLYWRRSNPKGMPRKPSTLVAVALYLCASQVTQQLVPLSMASQKHRDQVVRDWRGRYSFGYALGVDGRARWLVDRDEGGLEPSRGKERVGERFYY